MQIFLTLICLWNTWNKKSSVFFPIFHDVFICVPWFSIAGWWSSLILFGIPGRPFFDIWISERPFVNVYEWIDGGCFTNHNFSIFTYTFTICFRIFGGSKAHCFLHFPCNVQWKYDVCHLKSTAFVGQPLGVVFYCNIWDAGTAKNMKHKACWTSKVFTDSFTTCKCTLQKGHVIWCHKCSWHSCSPHIGELVGFYPMMLDDKNMPIPISSYFAAHFVCIVFGLCGCPMLRRQQCVLSPRDL